MNQQDDGLKTILYAEDDEDIRSIVEMTLEAMTNIEVISCKNGSEAILKSSSVSPDLVLLDVMMPDMDGLTVFEYLSRQEDYCKVPVILITARVQAHEIDEYLAKGVVGVIQKPFDPVTLPDQLIAFWEAFQAQVSGTDLS
ncbi:response regulator [Endozoicomonas arenosclerae]|uniref:response regulator n=1 Tax=Endozoicomonas arenosclerae TaxID=1633495 RepID=UPI000780DF81|nr:response regulator [Endozoicomonas arenosclerae]